MRTISDKPDLILHNAKVFTVDGAHPWAASVAVRDGVIIGIDEGDDLLTLAGSRTETIDAKGQLVLPGFCDAHIHFYNWSLALAELDLAATRSLDHMLRLVKDRALELSDDEWVIGRGWNESRWSEGRFPTAADLDQVTGPNQPAIFWRTDMHAAVVNSRAMRLADISLDTLDPKSGVIDRYSDGRPTGILRESAVGLVANRIPVPDPDRERAAVRAGISELHRIGVTAVHDQRMKDHEDGTHALATYQALDQQGVLDLRVNCNVAVHQLGHAGALGIAYGYGDDRLRLGHIKVFADGSLGSRTALLTQPFRKESPSEKDNVGVRLTELDQMAAQFRAAADAGFPISVHAIGDRANKEVLDIFEEMKDAAPRLPAPHRIEHVQIVRPEDLERLGMLAITASVQPIHVIDDMDLADQIMGERGARMYNFRSLLESGALLAFGSDAPVADPNPFLGIHAAMYRQRPERMQLGAWYEGECVSLTDAIHAYTVGPAAAAGWQHLIGSIQLGKRADMILLDRDLFEVAVAGVRGDEVSGTKVEMTLFDGEVVFSAH